MNFGRFQWGLELTSPFCMDIFRRRRSIRKYKADPVPMEQLETLVEAARWAPSAGNSQPWEFVLITDKKVVDILKMISPGWVMDAPAAIIMCLNTKRERAWSYIDLGAAMQNILLCAYSQGIGCCPIGSFLIQPLVDVLELPADLTPILIITVGYPNEAPSATQRFSVDELIFKRIGK